MNVRVRMYIGVRCINIYVYTAAAQTMLYIDIPSVCLYVCYNLVCISIYIYMYQHYNLSTQIICFV